jgi:hypothetical protein
MQAKPRRHACELELAGYVQQNAMLRGIVDIGVCVSQVIW